MDNVTMDDLVQQEDGQWAHKETGELYDVKFPDNPPEEEHEQAPESDEQDEPEEELEEELDDEDDEAEADEDDEDEEDDGEPIPEEEELDEEEESLINIDDADEDEDDEDDPDLDGVSDKEIADGMRAVSTYEEYFNDAFAQGKEVDDAFAADVARNRIDPSFLAEMGIHSLPDAIERLTELQEEVDPDRVTVPSEHAPEEEIAEFMHEYMGIPKAVEEYDDEKLFLGTAFEGDEDDAIRHQLKVDVFELGLSEAQARGYVERLSDERQQLQEDQEAEHKDYVRENKKAIKEIYGEDAAAVTKEISHIMAQHGEDFYNEFKGDKVMNSASFIQFVSNIAHYFTQKDSAPRLGIGGMSTSELQTRMDRLGSHKYFKREFAKHEDKKVQGKHKKLHKRYTALETELMRRMGTS